MIPHTCMFLFIHAHTHTHTHLLTNAHLHIRTPTHTPTHTPTLHLCCIVVDWFVQVAVHSAETGPLYERPAAPGATYSHQAILDLLITQLAQYCTLSGVLNNLLINSHKVLFKAINKYPGIEHVSCKYKSQLHLSRNCTSWSLLRVLWNNQCIVRE